MSKKRNLTSGMVVTDKRIDCRMTVDENNCMQYVVVCTEPNPAKPDEPIVTYTINGVNAPRPDPLLPCLEPGTTKPVYVMGGKLAVEGLTALVDLTPLTDALNILIEEQRKDTPFSKTRYCNAATGTWWEKLCVVEKQADGSYQTIVVSDEDTFESCSVEQNAARLVCLKPKNGQPGMQGWVTVSGEFGDAPEIKIYSINGTSELNLSDYDIASGSCC